MKTIVFIGTNQSGSSYEAIKASAAMGYYTILLTNRPYFMINASSFPHLRLIALIDLCDKTKVKRAIDRLTGHGLELCAIVSFIDPFCYTAAALSQQYKLPHFSQDGIRTMLDKIASRKVLDGYIYIPQYTKLTPNAPPPTDFPLILKVPTSAGSKDVYKVETPEDYTLAHTEIQTRYPKASILAEEYIDGPQTLIETLTIDGSTHIIAIIAQEITFTGRFIITGYQVILNHNTPFYASLKAAVSEIIARHGLTHGPCHLEMRHTPRGWKLIEANPRISGGALNTLIEIATGINLARQTLRLALGKTPDLTPTHSKNTFLQYILVPQEGILTKVTGKTQAIRCPGVEYVYIKPRKGRLILPPISMAYRYACVIATGNSAKQARHNTKNAAAKIKFHLRTLSEDDLICLTDTQHRLLQIAAANRAHTEKIKDEFDSYILSE